MGYACPVCGDPQRDAGHLANHLAFTAMLGNDDHEAWLDEHAPGWADHGERELAERVAERAEETDFPQVFEDTTGDGRHDPAEERSGALFDTDETRGPEHQHGHERDAAANADPDGPATPSADPETEEILEEAREMTREMLGDEAGDDTEDATDGEDASVGGGTPRDGDEDARNATADEADEDA